PKSVNDAHRLAFSLSRIQVVAKRHGAATGNPRLNFRSENTAGRHGFEPWNLSRFPMISNHIPHSEM
ncbi:MAG: hypothetical protein P8Q85_01500, partial [Candidatus Poseidoniaceae archaeon]|nr:hypothetical protein [Candidatus Poseidoniaceae archaeon]